MIDPLTNFDWSSLYACYDAMCRGFDPGSVHLKAITPHPQSDRHLYYRIVDHIHEVPRGRFELSIDLYEALLYWKLYSTNPTFGWLLDQKRRLSEQAKLMRLVDELPTHVERNPERIVNLVKQLDQYGLAGMKTPCTFPIRTTFLHYLFPDVVPIFDTMVLRAIGVHERGANHRIGVLREYLPFAWELAERHAGRFPDNHRETAVRLIDMALWVVRDR